MGFFYFLGKRKFYLQVLIAIALTIFIIWGVLQSLAWYTKHGQVYLVPDFKGKTVQQLNQEQYNKYFTFHVIDSVYDQKYPPGAIVMQKPLSGSEVKLGRNVYLTIVAKRPEMVLMPNLKNLSLRQALVTLEGIGLPVASLNYVDYFAKNAVIDQYVNNEPIEPKTKLPKGTPVTLIVGKGDNPSQISIPFLIGKKLQAAHYALHMASLNVGKEIFMNGNDTAHERVYRTDPSILSNSLMNAGDSINIWYRSDTAFNFTKYVRQMRDTTLVDTTKVDSTAIDSVAADTSKVDRTLVRHDSLH